MIDAGRRYWPRGEQLLRSLAVASASAPPAHRMVMVEVPKWAEDLGIGSPPSLLVDAACVIEGPGPTWERCDWWAACFTYLSGAAERAEEAARGPIHSYAGRLRQRDDRCYDFAWVNRICLLLRRWAAREARRDEPDLFGSLPEAVFDLTHDVDAVSKTAAVRLKQGAFHAYNAARAVAAGRAGEALGKVREAVRFTFSRADYWCFDAITDLEERFGRRSTFHFHAAPPGARRGLKQALMDPAYDVRAPRLRTELRRLSDGGWTIGLHPGFDTWRDATRLAAELDTLQQATGGSVSRCRQHWLRFSWADSWRAQQACGLKLDATLGFNDRAGFRVGAALRYRPWDNTAGRPHDLEAIPLILMDSHLYDYALLTDEKRLETIERWVGEVRAVGGEASIVWHQRVMHPDYGWAQGYEALLECIARCPAPGSND